MKIQYKAREYLGSGNMLLVELARFAYGTGCNSCLGISRDCTVLVRTIRSELRAFSRLPYVRTVQEATSTVARILLHYAKSQELVV